MSDQKNFNAKKFAIILIILFALIISAIYFLMNPNFLINNAEIASNNEQVQVQKTNVTSKNEYALTDNNFSKFDFSFLKFENGVKNKIYSPLSIKYAFKMLEEGATGKAKEQLSSIVNGYELTKYNTNGKMAFANAFFINNNFEQNVKQDYIDLLQRKYNAQIKFDDFSTAENVNKWVKENTLELIDELYSDEDVSDMNFALINALGIDMEWNHKFLEHHYDDDKNITEFVQYDHERNSWAVMETLYKLEFEKNNEVSSMEVIATLNNYDIVKELGEEKIKQIVKDDFTKWAKSYELYQVAGDIDEYFNNDFSDEGIEKAFEKYWAEGNDSYIRERDGKQLGYLAEIKDNYGRVDYTTDFSIYIDDDVKVFAKDLEKSDNATLQYIGIMPKEKDLDKFIEDTSEENIKDLIGNLKDLKTENFKDGVLTKITGYIPKFKFDYELNLKEELEKLGITDVFEQGKAGLTNISDDENLYIDNVKHKANIEFTENGIKAAATTGAGGFGAGEFYNYIFEIPIEEIDITFDKPYMFIIRDKDTGETWFVGTVYEPLSSEDEVGDISEIYNYDN